VFPLSLIPKTAAGIHAPQENRREILYYDRASNTLGNY
jgi:hypothetical protein